MITNETAYRSIRSNIATVQENLEKTEEQLKKLLTDFEHDWKFISNVGTIGQMLEVCGADLEDIKTLADRQHKEIVNHAKARQEGDSVQDPERSGNRES
jgi:hypothetical protein